MERKSIESIPDKKNVSLEREVFSGMIGHGLFGTVGDGPFMDIGTPESFESAADFMHAEVDQE
jgi:mannose-1-phosphate guanylyltransferase/D-glycero-alpha-D-manno-heptose 1-phosphate guanylyltransferase